MNRVVAQLVLEGFYYDTELVHKYLEADRELDFIGQTSSATKLFDDFKAYAVSECATLQDLVDAMGRAQVFRYCKHLDGSFIDVRAFFDEHADPVYYYQFVYHTTWAVDIEKLQHKFDEWLRDRTAITQRLADQP